VHAIQTAYHHGDVAKKARWDGRSLTIHRRASKELSMPYTFTLTAAIPATPVEIYQAWLDSLGHSEMTGGEASMSDEVGAEVTAWDGYISGRNLELIPGERIVQSWRTAEFGDADEDSVITVVLQEIGAGTLLTLEHRNVPDEHRSYEEGGWQSNYFEPMIAYFTEIKAEIAKDIAKPPKRRAPSKATPKAAPKKAAAKNSGKNSAKKKSGAAAKRPASARPAKRAAPRTKAAAKKKPGKAKAKRRAKSTARTPASGRRR
jgi:uncharacterized protein YndB with AHSA1/START domain